MLIDTHTHLQFKVFEDRVNEVIQRANEAGVEKIIVVGTNLETSQKAIELAEQYDDLYASVGIHPHHVFSYCHPEQSEGSVGLSTDSSTTLGMTEINSQLEQLIQNPKVIAIGETGLDRHIYEVSKYQNYQITEDFIELQKLFFKEQIKLAIKYQKSLIIHNRQAVPELLEVLKANWGPFLEHRSVFHCCEPDHRLLDFASAHNVFIGIDGDITYDLKKQEFMKKVPLELLILETDSPYFIPEPLRSALRHPRPDRGSINNEPKNLKIISGFIAEYLNLDTESVNKITIQNPKKLFNLKY